jgi:hypothetical protein
MKLIDALAEALKKANIPFERDSWTEYVGYDRPTKEGWIDIELPSEGLNTITVHLFFKDSEKVLTDVEVFENKKAVTQVGMKKLTKDEKPKIKEKTKSKSNSSSNYLFNRFLVRATETSTIAQPILTIKLK